MDFDNSALKAYLKQMESAKKMYDLYNNPAIKLMQQTASMYDISSSMSYITNAWKTAINQYDIMNRMGEAANFTRDFAEQMAGFNRISKLQGDYNLISCYPDDAYEEDTEEIEKCDNKVISEILLPDNDKIITEESPIIVLSPINDKILKYLAENPKEMYNLSSADFVDVMAEIYRKLGYDVQRTKIADDGGKDIIIKKSEALCEFIYYVECKKYAVGNPIGAGLVKKLADTVLTDKINGGILATTSFFSKDARKFISDNKLNFQVKLQDNNTIQELLKLSYERKDISEPRGTTVNNKVYYDNINNSSNSKGKRIFLSYCSKDEDLADIIDDKFSPYNNLKISRYTRDVAYKESFKEFMNSLREHDFVIMLISDFYLKSRACMFEVCELLKDNNYKEKIQFVIISDNDLKYYKDKPSDSVAAQIYDVVKRNDYILYWESEYQKIKDSIQLINSDTAKIEPLKVMQEIKKIIDHDLSPFINYLSDAKGLCFDEMYQNDFKDIIALINKS